MNRLITANFQSVKPEELGRYSTAHSYDVNGNIQTTQRNGVISSNGLPQSVVYQYGQMDNMQYSYAGNRLMKVNDAITTQTTLPDFNDNGSTDIDYGYDNNGNLTKDLNKKIESIAYNHLNLPIKIIFTGKGNITYTYNAAGAKLTKTVTEIGKPVKTVAYKYGFLFENEVLKEFATPEGRIVAKTPPSGAGGLGVFQFQYHYKDHLGNVRMTFAPYAETLANLRMTAENDSLSKETKDFTNLIPTRTTEKSAEGNFAVALQRGKGSISSRVLSVQKGQKLTLSVMATYDNENTLQPLSKFANSNKVAKTVVLGAASALSIQDVNVGAESKNKTLNINILGLIPIFKNLFSKPNKNVDNDITIPYKPQKPKSYIEIAVYKDSSLTELLHNQITTITENSEYNWENLQDSLTFKEDGFAVVSLRNESNKQVLFDDLNVRLFGTLKAAIIQENHYEPFGMTLLGLDYTLKEETKNVFLYNGKEMTEDLGLNMYEFGARNQDPQTGRFPTIDRFAEKYYGLTPFQYGANNPVKFIDVNGDYLEVSGNLRQMIRFALMLSASFEGNAKVTISFKTGRVDVEKNDTKEAKEYFGKKENNKAFNAISKVTNDKETTVGMTLTDHDDETRTDDGRTLHSNTDVGSYQYGSLDLDDLANMGTIANITNPKHSEPFSTFSKNQQGFMKKVVSQAIRGFLVHEISEQYYKQSKGYTGYNEEQYEESHRYATPIENSTYNGFTHANDGTGNIQGMYGNEQIKLTWMGGKGNNRTGIIIIGASFYKK